MALLYTHSAPEARTCSAAGDFQVYPGRGSHKVYHHDREVDNMTTQTRNEVLLEGIALEAPALSHENHGTRFYRFPLQVPRLSGTPDTLPVLVPEALLTAVRLEDPLRVRGQLRSFNNRSGVGNRLVLTVYAQAMEPGSGEPCNRILLSGALCKPPIFRRTPLGRSICDLMLAVNRHYGRSDYLPCITWGARACETALWDVGTRVSLEGRLQSRSYIKVLDTGAVERTAFEVSVLDICRLSAPDD